MRQVVLRLALLAAVTGPAWSSDPGRVTARRLNRAEYNNTVRDLLGIAFSPADDFPADDSGYGFDNIGDVLSLSPVLMEKYFAAAGRIARSAIHTGPPLKPSLMRYLADRAEQARRIQADDPRGYPYPPGAFEASHYFPVDAEYGLVLKIADRRNDKTQVVPVSLSLDGRKLAGFDIQDGEYVQGEFEVRIPVSAGEHTLYGAFPEDYVNSERRDPKNPATPLERAIFVDYFEVRGPYNHNPAESSSYRRIFRCNHPGGSHTDLCARQILTPLIRRAYRRPPAQGEVDRLLALYGSARQQGESFEQGIQLALKALLVSPHFLFRVEKDPNPKDASAHPVSETELASRLSYFLWSSMPDDELLSLAEQGRLRQPDVFEGQVRRMLRDRRSRALVDNFAGQWLHLRNLKKATPDPGRFPSFNEALRAAMARETELFFEHVLREDRSVLEFLDARYSFLNARLAAHYGVEGVRGREFRRVALDNGQRGGIVTQASILTVSSYPTRTSPVLRGLWVLENILGNPPPPPPPGVPQLNENAASRTGTLRQQLEQHRANPGCAVCHTRMDAIGFGLENYDAVGAWRTHDGGFPVDASGSLPGGKFFQGPAELRAILMKERDAFCRTLVQRTLTYALGRGLERYDKGAVEHISSRLAAGGFRFSTLILEIVRSDPFQMRRAEGDRK